MVQRTSFERERPPEFVAIFEMKTQHLALPELYIPEYRPFQVRHAQIATGEDTFHEQDAGQIGPRKITMPELTVLVFALLQGRFAEILPVEILVGE